MIDMLNTLTREVALVVHTDSIKKPAIATISIFSISMAILSCVSFYCANACQNYSTTATATGITIGLTFYFYGDNIGYILDIYGPVLGCGTTCQEYSKLVALFCLGTALIFYQVFPPILKKCSDEYGQVEYDKLPLIQSIVVIPKMDVVFTAVLLLAKTNQACTNHDLIVNFGFFMICITIGWVIMISHYVYGFSDHQRVFGLICIIVLIAMFPMYMLSDNQQPLDCIFARWGRNESNSSELSVDFNRTLSQYNGTVPYNIVLGSKLRIAFISASIFSGLIATVLMCRTSDSYDPYDRLI